ncbi:MAG: carboxypeptidase regulatory-like domain-containing protein [Ignavibacteriae bacterium]|nr:carboxypeptidase regulatory-like domain-containing protein [Ignavibacteriota bacterium]MCB9215194.1 carboxypeptidase regulatory-like domain-containing protein [Ignavibacteria bacterium]
MSKETKGRATNPTKGFKLEVPLDASGIEDRKGGEVVQVFAITAGGQKQSQSVKLDTKGSGKATFSFEEDPGQVKVLLGPETASVETIEGLQTVSRTVSTRGLADRGLLTIGAIIIPRFYWHWWLRWCRTFTIRGRVVCPDGNPVPGAKVCASDVDLFWWWSSSQQVGCDTTDADGTFEIKFRWCCGWWPWWWWRIRQWRYEPYIHKLILPELKERISFKDFPPGPEPQFDGLERFVSELHDLPEEQFVSTPFSLATTRSAVSPGDSPASIDARRIAALGDKLKLKIAEPAALRGLYLWPWHHWHPWNDCRPDINFRVTQICGGVEKTIVQEGIFDTRWNIPTTLEDVTLIANDDACCIPGNPDIPQGNCMVISRVCSDIVNTIGGNPGAPPAPQGYKNPATISTNGDRPYGGVIPISGLFGNTASVDYYEFERYNPLTLLWEALPSVTAGGFSRPYWEPAGGGGGQWSSAAFPFSVISGRNVIESREHYEANNAPGTWGSTRFWGGNWDLLMRWLTEGNIADATYRLRVVGYDLVGGALTNRRVLKLCNTQDDNEVIIRVDNRITGPGSGHPTSASHPAGAGTVHTETLEPDTDILSVKIIHADNTQTDLAACGKIKINATDKVQIDFFAHDPDGHLAYYSLQATYGENLVRNLLSYGTPVPLPAGSAPVPAAAQVGPNYGAARLQGAVAPHWNGGALRLEINAIDAFPQTCCYQIELRAYKRTIVNCNGNYPHRNLSEYSFMVEV